MGYKVLENQMRSIINNLDQGKEFSLRDIIQNPPARLGRTLYEAVQNGNIPHVQCIGIIDGVEHYKKL